MSTSYDPILLLKNDILVLDVPSQLYPVREAQKQRAIKQLIENIIQTYDHEFLSAFSILPPLNLKAFTNLILKIQREYIIQISVLFHSSVFFAQTEHHEPVIRLANFTEEAYQALMDTGLINRELTEEEREDFNVAQAIESIETDMNPWLSYPLFTVEQLNSLLTWETIAENKHIVEYPTDDERLTAAFLTDYRRFLLTTENYVPTDEDVANYTSFSENNIESLPYSAQWGERLNFLHDALEKRILDLPLEF